MLKLQGALNWLKNQPKITIEPVLFLFSFGWYAMLSSQVETNLLMWKICSFEFNQSEATCANFSANPQLEDQIYIRVNDFELIRKWISTLPPVLYSILAGSLSERYGRKPFMIMPLIGAAIGIIFTFANYIFIDTLPITFMYFNMEFWYFLLGGIPIFYLGTYSYGADISSDDQRASLLGKKNQN